MTTVFVCHRSADFRNGVDAITHILKRGLGSANVLVDRSSFVPGSAWLPQLRAQVAQADAVVLVVGSAWTERRPPTQDYVIEELRIARTLRKPIIPIVIAGTRASLKELVPKEVEWLLQLHFVEFDQTIPVDQFHTLLQSALPAFTETSPQRANQLVQLALRRLADGLVAPVRTAAASLHPMPTTVWSGVMQVLFASILFATLVSISIEDKLPGLTSVARGVIAATLSVALLIAILRAFSFLCGAPLAIASLIGFCSYFVASLLVLATVWWTVLAIVIPGPVLVEMFKVADGGAPLLEPVAGWTPENYPIRFVAGVLANWASMIHLAFVLWGFARAASMVLAWRHWTILLLITAPVIALALGLFYVVYALVTEL